MSLSRLNYLDPRYRDAFGGQDIRHFMVYSSQREPVGRVLDVLVDEAERFQALIIEVGTAIASKQVFLPLQYAQIDPSTQGVYLTFTRAQAMELPVYNPIANQVQSNQSHQNYQEPVSYPTAQSPDVRDPSFRIHSEGNVPSEQSTLSDPQTTIPPREVRSEERSAREPRTIPPIQSSVPVDQGNEINAQLLEERLIVDRKRQKVGEVIARKEIETHMIEVPVQREKLIIEQVGPEHREIASIDLGQEPHPLVSQAGQPSIPSQPSVQGEFYSARAASQFLQAIADRSDAGIEAIHINIVVQDPELQQIYQQWLTHYSAIR
jgi:hypothetical protein